jgi:hypothetical protein
MTKAEVRDGNCMTEIKTDIQSTRTEQDRNLSQMHTIRARTQMLVETGNEEGADKTTRDLTALYSTM